VTAGVQLKGRQKAAILLIALGSELSSQVLQHFQEEEIERLTREISSIRVVPAGAREEILGECYSRLQETRARETGGAEYAREVLIRALGERKADEILERVNTSRGVTPFEFMEEADPAQTASFLRDEHPQTVAVVLSHLSTKQAAAVLSNLDEGLRKDVATRIARMERISPDILEQVEQGLQVKFSTLLSQDYALSGGPDFLVKVLTQVDRATERAILESLEQHDPTLADEIRSKMFVFEDIQMLDNQAVQKVIQEVDRRDLALAMKGTTDKVRDVILRNMSTRAREMLMEEIDLLGPTRLSVVEQAQTRITEKIRELEAQEQLVIARGEDAIIT